MSKVETIFEWICQICSLFYFITPMIEVIRLSKKDKGRSLDHFPIILLISIMLNCLFWVLYGWNANYISMLVSNVYGLLINLILLFFVLYLYLGEDLDEDMKHYLSLIKPNSTKKPNQWNPKNAFYLQFIGYGLFMMNVLLEIGFLMYRYLIKDNTDKMDEVLNTIGIFAMVLNVFMYLSPGISFFINKAKGEIPIFTNVCGLVCCALWIVYGLLFKEEEHQNNLKTIISNLISMAVVLIQIFVWTFFYCRKGHQPLIKIDDNIEEQKIIE